MKPFTEFDMVLISDGTKRENADKIQLELRKISPIAKKMGNDSAVVPLEFIEKTMFAIMRKYEITIQWISHSILSDDTYQWSVSTMTKDTHKWLGSVNGRTMYEALAKGLLVMHKFVKDGEIAERKPREQEQLELKKRLGEDNGEHKGKQLEDDIEENWDDE